MSFFFGHGAIKNVLDPRTKLYNELNVTLSIVSHSINIVTYKRQSNENKIISIACSGHKK